LRGVWPVVQCAMAAKSSADDPVDLGPFLQNYVMKNPFRAERLVTADGRGAGDRAGPGGRALPLRWTLRHRRRRGSTTSNGAGRVGVSTPDMSDLLLGNDDTHSHGDDVAAW